MQNWTFNFQFRAYFSQKLVKSMCQTLHFIHWKAEARFRRKRSDLVGETDCFFSLSHHWSLIMTHITLRLGPTASPMESRLLNFFPSCSQWDRSHGDWGRVIVTVPALGCPGVSRWDLTRHGLSSLPYSPSTGGRLGKGAMRGGETLAVDFLCFIQTFVKTKMDRPLSKTYTVLQYCSKDHIFQAFQK